MNVGQLISGCRDVGLETGRRVSVAALTLGLLTAAAAASGDV